MNHDGWGLSLQNGWVFFRSTGFTDLKKGRHAPFQPKGLVKWSKLYPAPMKGFIWFYSVYIYIYLAKFRFNSTLTSAPIMELSDLKKKKVENRGLHEVSPIAAVVGHEDFSERLAEWYFHIFSLWNHETSCVAWGCMSLTSRTLSWSKDAQKTSGGWLVSDRSADERVSSGFFKFQEVFPLSGYPNRTFRIS